ncbi:SubName: Full=Uncharacterized protein {ECO:0000313/EMBL:CCA68643.1} [Serendipita indica DSM 11827]|nr:SubName: Full=Uncharacterized protein {ECO:0000313/EMBL:CCA68643.1} [Serendipita indica DSM 11827]
MASSSSPITQVSQTQQLPVGLQPHLVARLLLDLRGQRFSVDRETIMNLPESVLLCLFPNGLVLSRNSAVLDAIDDGEDEEIYGVDFDPQCFHYVLDYFKKSGEQFYGVSEQTSSPFQAQQQWIDSQGDPLMVQQNPLLSKQAIIVLREELEYFAIPPSSESTATDKNGIANERLLDLKRQCGLKLLEKRNIFTALQRNVNKENNMAEQHLIDMLCVSGFDRDDVWGFRAVEPNRCCLSSIALVQLKTGITHEAPTDANPTGVVVDQTQMTTAQKLLLFWRKPARKCWWDGIEVDLGTADAPRVVKLWARRVWTLELSLFRGQMSLSIDLLRSAMTVVPSDFLTDGGLPRVERHIFARDSFHFRTKFCSALVFLLEWMHVTDDATEAKRLGLLVVEHRAKHPLSSRIEPSNVGRDSSSTHMAQQADLKATHYTHQLQNALTRGLWADPSPALAVKGEPMTWSELLRKYKKHCVSQHITAEIALQTQSLSLLLLPDPVDAKRITQEDLDGDSEEPHGSMSLGTECELSPSRIDDARLGFAALELLNDTPNERDSTLFTRAYFAYALKRYKECLALLNPMSFDEDVPEPASATKSTRLQVPSEGSTGSTGTHLTWTGSIASMAMEKLGHAEEALSVYEAALPILQSLRLPHTPASQNDAVDPSFIKYRELWRWAERLLWRASCLVSRFAPIDRALTVFRVYSNHAQYYPPTFRPNHRSIVSSLYLYALLLTYPGSEQAIPGVTRLSWITEARTLLGEYRLVLAQSTVFPRAGDRNIKVEEYCDGVMAVWERAGANGKEAQWAIEASD